MLREMLKSLRLVPIGCFDGFTFFEESLYFIFNIRVRALENFNFLLQLLYCASMRLKVLSLLQPLGVHLFVGLLINIR